MDEQLNILLIDDDEDEYIFLKGLLSGVTRPGAFHHYKMDWVSTYEQALQAISNCQYDLFLVDYRLGRHSGLDVLREATAQRCTTPIIMLTGQGDYHTDLTAMELGAADYLEKWQINLPLLERSIRYAVEHARSLAALQKQTQEMDALQKATSSLLNTLDVPRLIDQTLDAARQAIPAASHSWLYLFEPPKGTLLHSLLEVNDARIHRINNAAKTLPAFKTISEGQPLSISDVEKEPGLLTFVSGEKHGTIGSFITAPLVIAQSTFGAISVGASDPFAFSEADLRLLSSFSVTVSTVIYNSILYAETQKLATRDSLTGKLNRRSLFEQGQREVDRCRRFDHQLSILMFDLDHFKDVNDTYGHSIGDQVLVAVAERCDTVIRNVDILGRYGGDEFTALLPEADRSMAADIANRIQAAILSSPIATDAGPIPVAISIGVAQADSNTVEFHSLFNKADQALYQSKQAGRNRITLAD